MYRGKDRSGNYLFKELMPFGGQLAEGNRWLKIKGLIPWAELEGEYAKRFSEYGRPGLDASSLTKIRHKLGVKWTKELEKKTYGVLIERKNITNPLMRGTCRVF